MIPAEWPPLDSYDEIPYDSTPVTETDPDRLAVIGRLFGLPAADPRDCRVLELGCAGGGNLLPLAWRYPQSRFLGVELSARQVADGQRMVGRLGLPNIEIRQGDILELGEDLGTFDYILCHGVYSWVPDTVRARILDVCATHLATHGVAYVSYNTLPGWRLRGMLRDMLLYATRDSAPPGERLARAQAFLDFILQATGGFDTQHTRALKQQIERIREAHPSYLYHEYLEAINEPVLFSDFVARARARGLGYLADTELYTMFPATLGDGVAAAVDGIEDTVEQEQYLDFIRNRNFRQTLLCRADALPERVVDLESFEGFAFYADLAPPKKLELRRPKAQAFRRVNGEEVTLEHPLTKAAVVELGRRYPDALGFGELVGVARAAVSAAGGGACADQQDHLFGELFSLFLHQGLGASLHAETFSRGGPAPRASALATAQHAEGLDHLATPRHTTLGLDPLARYLVGLLDGRRGLDDLVAAMETAIDSGSVPVTGWQAEASRPERRRAQLRANCERLLELFARQGVLAGG